MAKIDRDDDLTHLVSEGIRSFTMSPPTEPCGYCGETLHWASGCPYFEDLAESSLDPERT